MLWPTSFQNTNRVGSAHTNPSHITNGLINNPEIDFLACARIFLHLCRRDQEINHRTEPNTQEQQQQPTQVYIILIC